MARPRTAALAAMFMALPVGLGLGMTGPAGAASAATATTPYCNSTDPTDPGSRYQYSIGMAAGYGDYNRSGIALGNDLYFPAQFRDAKVGVPGFGTSLAVGDLNDDQCDDVVVGQPGDSGTKGYASILWGSTLGPYADGLTLIEGPDTGDAFGTAVAVGASNSDNSIKDVWIGAPDRTVEGKAAAGAVDHYTVDASGTVTFIGTITADSNGSTGTVHAGAHFGQVLSAYLGGVAIGAPDDTVSGRASAGSIVVTNLDHTTGKATSHYWTQDSPGVPGAAETADRFGSALYSENFVTLVGVPGEDVGTLKDAGSVQVFWNGKPAQSITQNSAGVPGTAEAGDMFGSAVSFGTDFLTINGGEDIAIGSPGEDVGSVKDAGSVTLLTLGATLGTYSGSKTLTQGSGGLGGAIEAHDRVGTRLGKINGDAADEEDTTDGLFVGVPGEDIGDSNGCGLITLYLKGAPLTNYEAARIPDSKFGFVLASTLPGYQS